MGDPSGPLWDLLFFSANRPIDNLTMHATNSSDSTPDGVDDVEGDSSPKEIVPKEILPKDPILAAARITEVAMPIVVAHGCELVDLEWRREPVGWVLRLFVEREGHDPRKAIGGVTLESCARISRDLGTVLEVDELIPHAYNLEVSSPGLERPLVKPADYRRFVGLRAKLQLGTPLDEIPIRKVFRGEIVRIDDADVVHLREDDLGEVALPLARIAKANLLADAYRPSPKPGKPGKKGQKPKSSATHTSAPTTDTKTK